MNTDSQSISASGESRRSLPQEKTATLTAAAAAPALFKNTVYGQGAVGQRQRANNRIVVGVIGTGKQAPIISRSSKRKPAPKTWSWAQSAICIRRISPPRKKVHRAGGQGWLR